MTDIIKDFPGPLISVAIKPKVKADQEKLSQSLQKLATEDSSFRVNTDPDAGLTVIFVVSELHGETIVDRLLREFNVDINVGKPRVAYKETIRSSAEREGKFIRQSGTRGQYGHVFLRVERLKGGKIFEFTDATKAGIIPPKYITAVEKGILEAMETGVVAGYPMVDIKVTLLDGSYHEVDSSETAFRIAGSMAFKEASTWAEPIILEPMMSVEVVVPDEFLGEVVGDLCARRGVVQGIDSRDGAQVITAEVPLAHMLGYTTYLHSKTQGRATYTMEFNRYVEVGPGPNPDDDEPVSMRMRVA